MFVEQYKKALLKLRSDVKPYWPAATYHHAPYKVFLLLAVMDLIAQSIIKSNLIKLDAELIDAFDLYWVKIVGNDRDSNPVMPFYHLHSQGFWHLVNSAGASEALQGVDRNEVFRRIKSQVLRAKLDDELFVLLKIADHRDELRRAMIEEYFSPDARPAVVEAGTITAQSFEYSRELLNRSRGRFNLHEAPVMDAVYVTEARSTAFRRVVVSAYNYTCAMCKIRIVTPEGRSAVAAAHIIPWSHSHNDDPRNGISLCGLHHWTFDQGLVAVTPELKIKISPIINISGGGVEPLLALDGLDLLQPSDRVLLPAREALRWHIANIFRSAAPERLL